MIETKTKIMAHRGASKEAPENSMSAFKLAGELNADGFELDVHVLFDKTVVVHHDGSLGRCDDFEPISIYDLRRSDLDKVTVGKLWGDKFKNEAMPLFSQVLDFLKGNNLMLNLEIKVDTCFIHDDVVSTVMDMLENSGIENLKERMIISSFNHGFLREIKRNFPGYEVGILYVNSSHRLDVLSYCLENNFDAVHPHFGVVDEAFVKRFHDNGIKVNVWTVNEPKDMERMARLGVDSIITDDVRRANEIIKS